LSIIDEEVDRMDASISEIFWTARVEAGILHSGKGPQSIRRLVDEALAELAPVVGSRSVTVAVPDSLQQANCDFQMIKGVLKELLTNALKYSRPDSPLAISARLDGDEIITSVADCGIGIDRGDETRIFDKQYRGRVQAPGSGLGLALAKTIVEAHGGRIGVNSLPGVGSVFHFSLPASHRDAA
jgi:signal transduction histidine kinase